MPSPTTYDEYAQLGAMIYFKHMHGLIQKMNADLPLHLRSAVYIGLMSSVVTNMHCDTSKEITSDTLKALEQQLRIPDNFTKH